MKYFFHWLIIALHLWVTSSRNYVVTSTTATSTTATSTTANSTTAKTGIPTTDIFNKLRRNGSMLNETEPSHNFTLYPINQVKITLPEGFPVLKPEWFPVLNLNTLPIPEKDTFVQLTGGVNMTTAAPPEISKILKTPVIVLNSILCITCVVLNGLVVSFYKTALKKIVPFLYFINALNDTIIGLGVALQSSALIPQIGSDMSGYLTLVSYVIVGVSIRVSTFVNLVLCIVRSIGIVHPFYFVNKGLVASSVVLWAAIWLALSLWDVIWFCEEIGLQSGLYVLKTFLLKPEVGFAALKAVSGGTLSNLSDIIILFGPVFLLPVLLLIASTVLQVTTLKTSYQSNEQKISPGPSGGNKRASITILILSLIYVVGNALSIILWIVIYWKYLDLNSVKSLDWFQLGITYFSGTTLFLISSILTPLVLILRGDKNQKNGLSKYFKDVVGMYRSTIRRLGTINMSRSGTETI